MFKNTQKIDKIVLYLNLFFLSLPAFSIFYAIIGIAAQSRLITILFLPYVKFKQYKFLFPLTVLFLYFCLYFFITLFDPSRDVLMYAAYALTFFYIIYTSKILYEFKYIYIKFFKIFFIINIIYSIFQTIMLNIGLGSLTFLHSNNPYQLLHHYIPPVFIEPIYRVTGLFGESAPYAFYLTISYVFFLSLGVNYKKYKYIALIALILSGAKFAYLFLIAHWAFFNKHRIIRYCFIPLGTYFTYLFFYNFRELAILMYGHAGSLEKRANELIESSSMHHFTFFGGDLYQSSNGGVSLDFYNIFINGFGYFGFAIFFLIITWFYMNINNKRKQYFIIPFFLGLIACGSIIILQYTLIVYSLIYLHNQENTV